MVSGTPAEELALLNFLPGEGVAAHREPGECSETRRPRTVVATPYKLVETARLCGADPREYLRRALRVATEKPSEVGLPSTMAAEIRSG